MGACVLKVWKEVPFSQIGRGPLRPPGPEALDSGKQKRVLSVNEAGAVFRLRLSPVKGSFYMFSLYICSD